jgi:hypothetical protein
MGVQVRCAARTVRKRIQCSGVCFPQSEKRTEVRGRGRLEVGIDTLIDCICGINKYVAQHTSTSTSRKAKHTEEKFSDGCSLGSTTCLELQAGSGL